MVSRRWESVNLLVATSQTLMGLAVVSAPWTFRFDLSEPAALFAILLGSGIMVVGTLSCAEDELWPARANLLLGTGMLFLLVLPGFPHNVVAVSAHAMIGLGVVVGSLVELIIAAREVGDVTPEGEAGRPGSRCRYP